MPRKIGELVVVALKARNLASPRGVIGKADPYAVFRVGETKKRTKTDKRGGQHPEWDDEVRFDITDEPKSKKMEVEVYNDDVREPDLIGSRKVDLQTVLDKGEQDEWFEIKSHTNKFAGEVMLEMTFYRTDVSQKPISAPIQNPISGYAPSTKPASYPITNNFNSPPPLLPQNTYPQHAAQSSSIYPPASQPPSVYPPASQPPSVYPPASQSSIYPPASQSSSIYPPATQSQYPPVAGFPSYSSPPIMSPTQAGGSNSLGFPVPVPTPNLSTNLSNASLGGGFPSYNGYPPPNNNSIYPPPDNNNNNTYPPPNNNSNIYPPPVGQQGYFNQGNPYPPH